MIDRLRRYAERLRFLRPVFAVLGAAGLAVAGLELFGDGLGETDYLAPSMILILWSLVGFASIGLFREIPAPLEGSAGWLARVKRNISRGFYYLLAISFVILTVAALYMTWRLLTL